MKNNAAIRENKNSCIIYAFLLVYGLLIAGMVIVQCELHRLVNIEGYMPARLWLLNRAIEAMSTGNLELFSEIRDSQSTYYYYLACITKAMRITPEAKQVYLVIQMYASAFLFAVYPISFYYLTKRKVFAILSPILLYLLSDNYLFVEKTDSYWVFGWIIAIGIPLLLMLWKPIWKKKEWCIFGFLCILIALANLPRAHGALPIALLLILIIIKNVVFAKQRPILLVAVIIVILAYQLMTSIVPAMIKVLPNTPPINEGFGPWHTLYIGLGVIEDNPYGIYYLDECAREKVESINPNVIYCGDEYMEIIKNEYFKIVKENPGFVLLTYIIKFLACFAMAMLRRNGYVLIWIMVSYLGILSGFISKRTQSAAYATLMQYRVPLSFCVIAGLFATAPVLVAVPWSQYGLGFITAYNMFAMFLVFLALKIMYSTFMIIFKGKEV